MLALDSLSDIERSFTRRIALEANDRVDDRSHRESRELDIELLNNPGSCVVSLGMNLRYKEDLCPYLKHEHSHRDLTINFMYLLVRRYKSVGAVFGSSLRAETHSTE